MQGAPSGFLAGIAYVGSLGLSVTVGGYFLVLLAWCVLSEGPLVLDTWIRGISSGEEC